MLKEFQAFVSRGNVLDLAVGVIIGGAFGKIVSSLVSDMLMPPLGLVIGKIDFSSLFLNLGGTPVKSLADAKAAGIPTLNYGIFIDNVIQFFILAFIVFLLVKTVSQVHRKPAAGASTKTCPFCAESIPTAAIKCGRCTSDLKAA